MMVGDQDHYVRMATCWEHRARGDLHRPLRDKPRDPAGRAAADRDPELRQPILMEGDDDHQFHDSCP